MKSKTYINCLALVIMMTWYVSIYTFSVKTIEGPMRPLSAYEGKKMLIITLPVVQNSANDSFLYAIDSLGDAYETSLKIIGVPSYEDGYTPSQKQQLKQWYRNFLDSSILITDGMRTRKSSGNHQDALFKWLTYEGQNGFMNEEVTGPAMKFFIRANGELFGVLKERSRLNGYAVHRMLQTQ